MPRISNIEILQKMEQPTIFIRTNAKVQELPVLIGQSFGKMAAYLQEVGNYWRMCLLLLTITWICKTLTLKLGSRLQGNYRAKRVSNQAPSLPGRWSFTCTAALTARWCRFMTRLRNSLQTIALNLSEQRMSITTTVPSSR